MIYSFLNLERLDNDSTLLIFSSADHQNSVETQRHNKQRSHQQIRRDCLRHSRKIGPLLHNHPPPRIRSQIRQIPLFKWKTKRISSAKTNSERHQTRGPRPARAHTPNPKAGPRDRQTPQQNAIRRPKQRHNIDNRCRCPDRDCRFRSHLHSPGPVRGRPGEHRTRALLRRGEHSSECRIHHFLDLRLTSTLHITSCSRSSDVRGGGGKEGEEADDGRDQ